MRGTLECKEACEGKPSNTAGGKAETRRGRTLKFMSSNMNCKRFCKGLMESSGIDSISSLEM